MRALIDARRLAMAWLVFAALLVSPAMSYAQHGNYLLGTIGLLGASQAPEGIYYENLFSYYHASGSANLDASRVRSAELLGRQLNLTVSGSLNRNSSLDVYGGDCARAQQSAWAHQEPHRADPPRERGRHAAAGGS